MLSLPLFTLVTLFNVHARHTPFIIMKYIEIVMELVWKCFCFFNEERKVNTNTHTTVDIYSIVHFILRQLYHQSKERVLHQ